jgi:hypothetical protein
VPPVELVMLPKLAQETVMPVQVILTILVEPCAELLKVIATVLSNALEVLKLVLLMSNLIHPLCAVLLMVVVMWPKLVTAKSTLALVTHLEHLALNVEANKEHAMLLRHVLVTPPLAPMMLSFL